MTVLSVTKRGAVAVVTIDGPHSSSSAMLMEFSDTLRALGRDPMVYGVVMKSAVPGIFTVSGEEIESYSSVAGDAPAAWSVRSREYELCWQIECFSKPIVSLIDGTVGGIGHGLSLYGTHRVAGEKYASRTLHSTGDVVPDYGVLYALARMPNAIGRYLALTGRTIGRADAYFLGLVTHCISSARFAEIEALFAQADPIDPILDSRHENPGASDLALGSERIQSYFEGSGLDETLARLRGACDSDREWAQSVLVDLDQRSALALALTDEALRRAATLDIAETLQQDFRLVRRMSSGARRPKDSPPASGEVAAFFAPLGDDDLTLPPREQMQAARS